MNHRLFKKLLTLCVLAAGLFLASSGDLGRAFADGESITYEQCVMLGGHRVLLLNGSCVCDGGKKVDCEEVGNIWDMYSCTCSIQPQFCNELVAIRCNNGGGTYTQGDDGCKCNGGGTGFCDSGSFSACSSVGGTWDPSNCTCSHWYGGTQPATCNQSGASACTMPGAWWDSERCRCVSPESPVPTPTP